jgi:hypothetical protein
MTRLWYDLHNPAILLLIVIAGLLWLIWRRLGNLEKLMKDRKRER